MRNTWLAEQLDQIQEPNYQKIIQAAKDYIEELEDDNESLQISLEGSIWSPNRWNEKIEIETEQPEN
ncbi:hypothetical protein P7G51_07330 [Enterococcus asini]|uniref:hypothetical protein n=1 Tax=Enterococcus asini TaxID=57732 RepID=UPI00288D5882|nr:hypothetical protein [Enterococcus asini]MDT2757190.1 hypothetical protein [Enterococcus asini]